MKIKGALNAVALLGFVIGMITTTVIYESNDCNMLVDEPPCETIALHQLAFEQCLRNQPGCRTDQAEFFKYHEQKDWMTANCIVIP